MKNKLKLNELLNTYNMYNLLYNKGNSQIVKADQNGLRYLKEFNDIIECVDLEDTRIDEDYNRTIIKMLFHGIEDTYISEEAIDGNFYVHFFTKEEVIERIKNNCNDVKELEKFFEFHTMDLEELIGYFNNYIENTGYGYYLIGKNQSANAKEKYTTSDDEWNTIDLSEDDARCLIIDYCLKNKELFDYIFPKDDSELTEEELKERYCIEEFLHKGNIEVQWCGHHYFSIHANWECLDIETEDLDELIKALQDLKKHLDCCA